MTLKALKIHPAARLPTYATDEAACFDFYACEADVVGPFGTATIRTGIAVQIPKGYCLKIYSRSGHGFKHGISLVNSVGVIDSDYRGEIMVGLRNDKPFRFDVKAGDRIAQGMLELAPQIEIEEVYSLDDTARGAGGFGSTGA